MAEIIGEWVKKPSRLGFESMQIWACNLCNKAFTFRPDYNFCPCCGTVMRKKEGAEE